MFTYEDYIEWLKLSYGGEHHYEGWELMWKVVPEDLSKKDERIKELNKKMIEEFPFLLPRNRWTDKVEDDYDYDYNEWEAIPLGWQIAFGWKLLHELNILVQGDLEHPEDFRIEQIKEKFGELRIYTNGSRAIRELIEEYTNLSTRICIACGKPAYYMSKGWISPFCEEHIPDINNATRIEGELHYNG